MRSIHTRMTVTVEVLCFGLCVAGLVLADKRKKAAARRIRRGRLEMADISEPASTLLKDGFVASAIAGIAYVLARTGESWWRLFVFAFTLSVAWTYIVSGQVVRRGVPIRGGDLLVLHMGVMLRRIVGPSRPACSSRSSLTSPRPRPALCYGT